MIVITRSPEQYQNSAKVASKHVSVIRQYRNGFAILRIKQPLRPAIPMPHKLPASLWPTTEVTSKSVK